METLIFWLAPSIACDVLRRTEGRTFSQMGTRSFARYVCVVIVDRYVMYVLYNVTPYYV